MAEKGVRSTEWRRKHSIAMHKMVSKLLRLKKAKEKQFAKQEVLKKRAAKLAKAMIRKRFSKKSYNSLSTAQKMALDRMMKRVSQPQLHAIAKRLVPVVTAHERERMKHLREDELYESGTDYKRVLKQKAAAQRSKHKRHKRSGKAMTTRLKGEGPGSHSRLKARTLRKAMEKRYGKTKGDNKFSKISRLLMARLADNKTAKKRIGSKIDRERKAATHFNRSDMTKTNYVGRHKYATGSGLYTSYDYDAMSDMILEGNMDRFHALFLRGLVDKSKIEYTKRIFSDLDRNIKFRRFQDDVVEMVDKLIKLITQDDTIYNKVTQRVQRSKHKVQ